MAAAEMQRKWDIEDRDEARAYSRKALDFLVQDAEAAGFNPLTVLRAGGGASYNAAAGFAPLSRTAPVQQATPGAGSYIGESLQAVGNNWLANWDPYAGQKRELERGLAEAQIANLNASTRAMGSQSFLVPTWGAGTTEKRASGSSGWLSKGGASAIAAQNSDWLTPPDPSKDALPIWVPGKDRDGKMVWIPNPDGPDAEQLAFAGLARMQSGFEAAASAAYNWRDGIKVSKVAPMDGRRKDDAFVPVSGSVWDYFPAVRFQWR